MSLAVAIASITPWLAETARASVLATTPDASVRILYGPESHGAKLDRALASLPATAEWFFTLDDDAALLSPGWFAWLRERMRDAPSAGFDATRTGGPHPSGALYRVAWLRARGDAFEARWPPWDVADRIGVGTRTYIAPAAPPPWPWWLRGCRPVVDDTGRLLWAHLGGGTIGATSWRIPRAIWPWCVRRALTRGRVW